MRNCRWYPKWPNRLRRYSAFCADLYAKARPFAEKDMAVLREFARSELGLETLKPGMSGYASEKLRRETTRPSPSRSQPYFTEPKVLAGLFHVVEALYGLHIKPDSAPVWHEDVRFFRIETPDGALVGRSFDPYARETKRGGAWMDEARTRRRTLKGMTTEAVLYVLLKAGVLRGLVDEEALSVSRRG